MALSVLLDDGDLSRDVFPIVRSELREHTCSFNIPTRWVALRGISLSLRLSFAACTTSSPHFYRLGASSTAEKHGHARGFSLLIISGAPCSISAAGDDHYHARKMQDRRSTSACQYISYIIEISKLDLCSDSSADPRDLSALPNDYEAS